MNYWFTADTHFYHKNILKLCNRPFIDINEMNTVLIDNINKKVKTDDKLYFLGDFGWGDIKQLNDIRNLIKCNNITLIYGNHDKELKKNITITNKMFSSVHDILDIEIGKQYISLCHYPFLEWNKFWHGSWHLYGHVHGNLNPIPGSLACDVGVDCHNYEPISFEDLCIIMEKKKA